MGLDDLGHKHKLAGLIVVAAALALGASLGLAWTAGFPAIAKLLVFPHWPWLAAALAGETVAYLGYVVAYREVAQVEHGAELELPRAAALVATGFGVFVVAGGFSLDAEALRRAGLGEGAARARVLALGALEYAVLAPAACIAALLVLLDRQGVDFGLTLPWLIAVPLGFLALLPGLQLLSRLRGPRGWRLRVAHALDAVGVVLGLLRRPVPHGLAFAGIALYWAGDIFCLWACLHAFFASSPPASQLVLGYATGYALTRRTLPLGGAGVVEALLPFSLGWVGIALGPAVLAVVAYRVLNLWLPIVPALAGIPTLRRLSRQDRRLRGSRRAR